MDIITSIVLIVLATYIIAKACDGFETAADYIGRNLSDGVKGASINAVGSSMPELFTTFVFLFLFTDTSGFAGGIGTTAGSAVFNSMIIPAASILAAMSFLKIAFISVSKKVIMRDGLMLIIATFFLITIIGDTLNWWHGLMLMLLYIVYACYLFMSMTKRDPEVVSTTKHDTETADDNTDDGDPGVAGSRIVAFFKLELEFAIIGGATLRTANAWILLSVATIIIALACYILVYGCELFGHSMGIHGYFVAVVLAAAASSVPDTILSIKDARKGNYDDAVSNALGSNIFDICFALGLPLFIFTIIYGPIAMPEEMANHISELLILLLFLTIGAFFIFIHGSQMGKLKAWSLLGLYGIFTSFIVGRAYDLEWARLVAEQLHIVQSILQ